MAEKEFSCIKQVVKTVQIPLPATFISNEKSGIPEILDSWKRQYSKQLQGVVVNYKHLSLSPSNGFIAPNKPFVYCSVKATFDLFCPKVGDIVKGKINHISMKHILCLVEDTISVAIHLSSNAPKEIAPFIGLNREILFEIKSFSFDKKMALSVTAKITRRCIQLMNELFPSTFGSLVDTPELSNNTDERIGTSSESADDGLLIHTFEDFKVNDDDVNFKKPFSTDKKSKKKSSKRTKNNSESSTDTSDMLTSDEKPKKKKHKDKSNPDTGNDSSANNLTSDTVSSDTLIQNFSSFNHSEILDAIKEKEAPKKHKKSSKSHKKDKSDTKKKKDSSKIKNSDVIKSEVD